MNDVSDPACPWTVNLAAWMLVALIIASASAAALFFFDAQFVGNANELTAAFRVAFVIGCVDLIFLIFALFLWSPGHRWLRIIYLMALVTIAMLTVRDLLPGSPVLAGYIKAYLILTYLFLVVPRSAPWFQKVLSND